MAIRMEYSRLYPDSKALQTLKSKGVKLAVVTSAAKRAADVDLGLIKGRIGSRIFDATVGVSHEPSYPPKPDPAAINACLERLSVGPEETFGVGNSAKDLEAYRRAGVFDILLDRGEGADSPAEAEAEHSMKITSLEELVPEVIVWGRLSRVFGRRVRPWPR
jgi:phosphoglycolate phosphatase